MASGPTRSGDDRSEARRPGTESGIGPPESGAGGARRRDKGAVKAAKQRARAEAAAGKERAKDEAARARRLAQAAKQQAKAEAAAGKQRAKDEAARARRLAQAAEQQAAAGDRSDKKEAKAQARAAAAGDRSDKKEAKAQARQQAKAGDRSDKKEAKAQARAAAAGDRSDKKEAKAQARAAAAGDRSDKKEAKAQARQQAAAGDRSDKKEAKAQARQQAAAGDRSDKKEAKAQARQQAKAGDRSDKKEAKAQARAAAAGDRSDKKEAKAQARAAAAGDRSDKKEAKAQARADEAQDKARDKADKAQDKAEAREEKRTARLDAYAAKERVKIERAEQRATKRARRRGPAAARAAAQMSARKRARAEVVNAKNRARLESATAREQAKLESAAAREQAKIDALAAKAGTRAPVTEAPPPAGADPGGAEGEPAAAAAPVPIPARRLRRQRRRAWSGIEVDGTTVRVVEIDGDEIVWFHTYEGNSASYALEQWRSSMGLRRRRPWIVWAGGHSHFERLEIPALPDNVLSEYIAVNVADKLPLEAGEYVTAAAEGAYRAIPRIMSVVAIETAALQDLWPFLEDASVDLVPAEFILGADGLFLAVRNSCAVLVLAEEGVLVAGRELACGGLDVLEAQLSDSGPEGEARLAAVLEGNGHDPSPEPDTEAPYDQSPEPQSQTDTYTEELVSEVRSTMEFWQSQGLSVPSEVLVCGRGAALPGLHDRFEAASVRSSPTAPPEGARNLDVLPAAQRQAYYGAIGALVNAPVLSVSIANPLVVSAKAHAKLIGRRLRSATAAAAAVALIVWFGVLPVIRSNQEAAAAEAEALRTIEELGDVGETFALFNELVTIDSSLRALHAGEPDWEVLLGAISLTAPEGTEFETLVLESVPCPAPRSSPRDSEQQSADQEAAADDRAAAVEQPDPGCILAGMDTALPQQDFLLVADWIRNLEDISGFDVLPDTLVVSRYEEERATMPFDVQFALRLPNEGAFRTPRDLLGGEG